MSIIDYAQNWPTKIKEQLASDLLKDKTVMITGASDGIGAELSKCLGLLGANIILLGKTRHKLEALFDEIAPICRGELIITPCDLSRLEQGDIQKLNDSIENEFNGLDALIHCASILGPKVPLAHYPPDAWAEVMMTNANSVFLLNQGLFDLLEAGERSCVIHVSSTVGRKARAYWGAYAVSKFAVEGISQLLADETEDQGKMKVFSINPGATRTKMRKEAYPFEDSKTVPDASTLMPLFSLLIIGSLLDCPLSRDLPDTGGQIDARTWQFPN